MGQFVGVEDHCHEAVVPAALVQAELDCLAYADVGAVNLGIVDEGLERDVRRGLALQAIPYPLLYPHTASGRPLPLGEGWGEGVPPRLGWSSASPAPPAGC